MRKLLTTQPDPSPNGYAITPKLLISIFHYEQLSELIQQRYEFGMQKYGQPLMSLDGRSGLVDAQEEMGDLVQYVFKVFTVPENLDKYTSEELKQFKIVWEQAKETVDKLIKEVKV